MGPRHSKLGARISIVKHLLAITIALLPSAVLAQQFTPEQMLEVMTKSPSNRDVRVHDVAHEIGVMLGMGHPHAPVNPVVLQLPPQ